MIYSKQHPIDYSILGKFFSYYQSRGFEAIETPWAVSKDTIRHTLDPECLKRFILKDDTVLVGSAEQGFLAIYDDLEPNKKYMSVGPCFREESDLNDLHFNQFIKLELFVKGECDLLSTVAIAILSLYSGTGPVVERTPQGKDLYLNGIEVASSYIQKKDGLVWSCATGLALPRFQQALMSQ